MATRYLAEWMSRMAHHPETGDVEPDLCEYETAAFGDMASAARHGCDRNCYGRECFVDVQEWDYDAALYDDTGRKRWGWRTAERHLCQDGRAVERVG